MEEASKDWVIEKSMYFKVYAYNSNLQDRLAIYQVWGKATLWWEEFKFVNAIEEQKITWEELKKNQKKIFNKVILSLKV